MIFKDKYYLYVVKEVNNSYKTLLMKQISVKTTEYQVSGGNNLSIDISKPTFSKKLKHFYFLDIEKGQLSLLEPNEQDKHVRNLLYKHEVVKQLTLSLLDKLKIKFDVMWIVCGGFGLFAGLFIRGMF